MEISKLEQLKAEQEELNEKRQFLKENKWQMETKQYKFLLSRYRSRNKYLNKLIALEEEKFHKPKKSNIYISKLDD